MTSLAKTFTCTLAGAGPNKAFPCVDELPFDSVAFFGSRARVNVKVTVNGVTLDMSLAPMGGRHVLGFRGELAAKARLKVGDRVRLTIARDDAKRESAAPPDLAKALARNAKAKAAWEALAPSHKKEHARAIEEAKRPETRSRRVEAAIAMLVTKGRPDRPKPSEKPLAQRIGMKPGMTALVDNAPRGVRLDGIAGRAPAPRAAPDLVLLFTEDPAGVARAAKKVAKTSAKTAVWVAYPKTTSGVATDLTRDAGWEPLDALGWHTVRQVAIDATWSALCFKKKS